MDTISQKSKSENFEFRKSVRILKMGYIVDLCDVNECGKPIREQFDFTASELSKRKLQINHDKSARMHVKTCKCRPDNCEILKADKWTVERKKRIKM